MNQPKIICECGKEMKISREIPKSKGGREVEYDMICDCGTKSYLLFVSMFTKEEEWKWK